MSLTKQELNDIALDLIGYKNERIEDLLNAEYWSADMTKTMVADLQRTQKLIKKVIKEQSEMKEES